jgi:hypothetical protein
MPNLVGMDYYEAKDTYAFLDLQIDQTDYTSYEQDIIYFQDIQVGEPVPNGQPVKVNVSLGISMTTVPDVKGYNYEYYEKTFLDFYTIAGASEVYLLKGPHMMKRGFPYAAALVGRKTLHIIDF